MRVEQSIEVAAPREDIWKHVSEPKRYSEFMYGSTWKPVEGEPTSGPRARFWLTVEVGSTELGGVVELVEWDPPHELAWTNVSGIDNRGRWILRDRGEATEVTMRFSYQVPGGLLALLASRLSAPILRRDVRRSLEALKEAVEGGPMDGGAA
jgi:uncharacterized membrane protein